MAQKKSYSRYFIILQEDEKGYSLSADKIVSGYLKSELKGDKCKISYYVQNLKKQSIPYHMVLICNKKDMKKIINMGKMNIDDYGRADVSYEYPASNIAGTGIAMDKICGAAIVKFLDSSLISIMSGFTSKQIPDWKNFEVVKVNLHEDLNDSVSSKQKQEEPHKNSEHKILKQKEDNKGKYHELSKKSDRNDEKVPVDVESVETSEAQNQEKSIFDKYEEIIEENKGSEDEIEKEKVLKDKETVNVIDADDSINNENKEKQVHEVIPCEENKPRNSDFEFNSSERIPDINMNEKFEKTQSIYEDDIKKTVPEFFSSLVDKFESVGDICGEIKRCDWYKAKVNSVEDMYDSSNVNKYNIIYRPMLPYYDYISRYGYYMIGYKYDKMGHVKYLVYGVPGTRNKYDQPFDGRSGFVTWTPLWRGEDNPNSIGCWLMFYDFRTSTVLIPVKSN
ncbi:hypothetical protein D4Z93_00570 [Clostridium fermenticellae]|uniref:Transmembrane protein n=1 Tax=Clostridium fermenticellae TaxID=2068654 RepID=A0A386H0H4_9CLOT|nr:hypothetical protein [Clostridium fermenticellae]AYD39136.1 hypothetical protein D4Z93_00570 [Clostridium fermenticellae]